MKRVLVASTAAMIALGGAAFAATAAVSAEDQLKRLAPDVDLSVVSDTALIHALNVIHDAGEDDDLHIANQVRSILRHVQ